ncbi:glycosyltransferase family 2 protein, partial [Candidatus Saccharibacteria bacterium]|nr:glycosyltransferase family 2 protein [Candidatus Saccharibacteria bacterium]
EKLVQTLDKNPKLGAATGKVLHADGKTLDSTSDYLTSWGLPYPRGRGEEDKGQYDHQTDIVSPSGAATLYRVDALKETGLFDEDFFAYYEDVDLGLRLQLNGWKAAYVPEARVYHAIGMTSSKIKGFTTYQTMKNLPLLAYKIIPEPYLKHVQRRLNLALALFAARSITRGHLKYALKGLKDARRLKNLKTRQHIQSTKKLSDQQVWD